MSLLLLFKDGGSGKAPQIAMPVANGWSSKRLAEHRQLIKSEDDSMTEVFLILAAQGAFDG